MAETVRDGKVVLIQYTLKDAETGEQLDSSGAGVMAYLHGRANVVPGLEAALDGLAPGEAFDVTVSPAEGYGEREEGWPKVVPRRELRGIDDLRKGQPFRAQGSSGDTVVLWVVDIRGSRVSIDLNHPLAGKTLHFTGTVVDLRDPTPEEHAHGHAHGPSGEAHG